jgi:hypothetical protein
MSDTDRSTALANLQVALTALSRQLAAVESLPPHGLEELKVAVDDVRLRLWSLLMASSAKDSRGFLERFRIRRAAENLRMLVEEVDAGVLRLGHQEATELAVVTGELQQRLAKIPKIV